MSQPDEPLIPDDEPATGGKPGQRTALEAAILAQATAAGPEKSICPSEVARQLAPQDWRALMPRVRVVASSLAQAGQLEIAQRGKPVSPQGPWRGPIRIRVPARNSAPKTED